MARTDPGDAATWGFWNSPGEPRCRGNWRTISRACLPSSTSCAGRVTHNLGSTGSGTGRPHSLPGCICRGCACVISMPIRSRGSITGASRARYRASAGADAQRKSAATDPTSSGFWTISRTPVRSSLGVAPSGRTGSASQAFAPGSRTTDAAADLNEEDLFDVEYADVLGIPSPLPASATSGALSCTIGLRARRIEFAHARTAMAGTGSDPEIVDTMAVSATKTRVTGTRRTKWREPSPRLAWSCRT